MAEFAELEEIDGEHPHLAAGWAALSGAGARPRLRSARCPPARPPRAAGLRMVWNVWPHSRLEAAKSVLPFGVLYTPAKQTSQLQARRCDRGRRWPAVALRARRRRLTQPPLTHPWATRNVPPQQHHTPSMALAALHL